MRSPDYGIIDHHKDIHSKQVSLDLFRRICLSRYFDYGSISAVQKQILNYMVYLSLGQESISAAVSKATKGFMVFSQHRCHDIYLSYGGDPKKMRDELVGLPTGTSRGRAGSNCIQCHTSQATMFGHHGLIAENVPQAVGAALGSGKPVVAFFGDGSAEEDYVFASLGFAVTHKLPVLFIVSDNNLSILTKIDVRRSWKITDVAKGFGMPAVDITDDPWSVYAKTLALKKTLPALMNIYTCRKNWHVGIGVDGPPEWDRFALVKDKLKELGYLKYALKIESKIKNDIQRLWDKKLLQKRLNQFRASIS